MNGITYFPIKNEPIQEYDNKRQALHSRQLLWLGNIGKSPQKFVFFLFLAWLLVSVSPRKFLATFIQSQF